jgi:hypothetical protein
MSESRDKVGMSICFAQLDYGPDFCFNVFRLNLADGPKELSGEQLSVRQRHSDSTLLSDPDDIYPLRVLWNDEMTL